MLYHIFFYKHIIFILLNFIKLYYAIFILLYYITLFYFYYVILYCIVYCLTGGNIQIKIVHIHDCQVGYASQYPNTFH